MIDIRDLDPVLWIWIATGALCVGGLVLQLTSTWRLRRRIRRRLRHCSYEIPSFALVQALRRTVIRNRETMEEEKPRNGG